MFVDVSPISSSSRNPLLSQVQATPELQKQIVDGISHSNFTLPPPLSSLLLPSPLLFILSHPQLDFVFKSEKAQFFAGGDYNSYDSE
jgi:hypothetical protein